ncbi:aminotransferase class V-fold PLP-dependent enzyme [Nonomuraea sp. NPDC050786]|uniref:kynureninase n=1 Tax=Nonomuraea sp. NPDC050786 TaxID=3154840 RepID=UPI0033CB5AE4
MTVHHPTLDDARRLDAEDPLAPLRDRFVPTLPGRIYLDGHSLGRPPAAAQDTARALITTEWAHDLVNSWFSRWMRLQHDIGDLLGRHFLGAAPGQVVVTDSTGVNLYKLARAAVPARPERRLIVCDRGIFPTDRYILEGVAAERGLELRLVAFDEITGPTPDAVARVVDERTALVCLSHVDYRSGAIADMAAINAVARSAGALTLWDLCHSAGAVPVELDACGADLAVGCTYKYLSGGPGAPAFAYVRRPLQDRLTQPIWGWFGHRDQFAMPQGYDPAPGIRRFLVGTPPVLSLALVEDGCRLLAEPGIAALRAKSQALTGLLIELYDAWLAPLGVRLAGPREAALRGGHVAFAHPAAERFGKALEAEEVIVDVRPPDRLRFGLAPATTSFTEVWTAADRFRGIAAQMS